MPSTGIGALSVESLSRTFGAKRGCWEQYAHLRVYRRQSGNNHLTRNSERLFETGAERIGSQNSRRLEREELVFPGVRVVSPARLMEELR